MEYYTGIKRNELLTQTTIGVNRKCIMLNGSSQTKNKKKQCTDCVSTCTAVRNTWVPELEVGMEVLQRGWKKFLPVMDMFTISTVSWLHKYVIMYQIVHFKHSEFTVGQVYFHKVLRKPKKDEGKDHKGPQ